MQNAANTNVIKPIWRRGRDSNPRYTCAYSAFRVRCDRPLCHLSGALGGALKKARRGVGGPLSMRGHLRQGGAALSQQCVEAENEAQAAASTPSQAICATNGTDSPTCRASSGFEALPSSERL